MKLEARTLKRRRATGYVSVSTLTAVVTLNLVLMAIDVALVMERGIRLEIAGPGRSIRITNRKHVSRFMKVAGSPVFILLTKQVWKTRMWRP